VIWIHNNSRNAKLKDAIQNNIGTTRRVGNHHRWGCFSEGLVVCVAVSAFTFSGGNAFLNSGNIRVRKDGTGDPLGCLGDLGWCKEHTSNPPLRARFRSFRERSLCDGRQHPGVSVRDGLSAATLGISTRLRYRRWRCHRCVCRNDRLRSPLLHWRHNDGSMAVASAH
jgi:hypothetical protein